MGCQQESGRVVEAVWRNTFSSEAETQVMKKIAKCGSELTQWSCKNFGHVRRELVEKRKWLVKLNRKLCRMDAILRLGS